MRRPKHSSRTRSTNDKILVSVEHVSKEYPPPEPMRVRRLFARLGGLQLEELLPEVVEEEDEDSVVDDDEQVVDRGGFGRRVIDSVSLQAHAGSRLALVGPEGAGKTLLLKLICGIVPPSRGRIVVHGLAAPALNALARSLPKGQTLQTALPYVAAIAGIPPGLVRSRLDEIAAFLEFPQLKGSWTNTLESRQKAEILLATMLSVEPDVILTDIPIGRDAFGERCLQRLDDLRARGSLLVSEARDVRNIVPVPDRIVRLYRGRIVAGEPQDPVAHNVSDDPTLVMDRPADTALRSPHEQLP